MPSNGYPEIRQPSLAPLHGSGCCLNVGVGPSVPGRCPPHRSRTQGCGLGQDPSEQTQLPSYVRGGRHEDGSRRIPGACIRPGARRDGEPRSRAVGEGRLSIEEGMQRIDAVLRSRHRHQLGALVADLPTHPSTAPRPSPPHRSRRTPRRHGCRGPRRRARPGPRRALGAVAVRRAHTRRLDTAASREDPVTSRPTHISQRSSII